MQDKRKRGHGQYYTRRNPFDHVAFRSWADEAGISREGFLEPFAGAGHLFEMLKELGLSSRATGYDILPAAPWVERRDTLSDFPEGFRAIVTNPPYLARNSARRRGLNYPDTSFPDLYLHALDLCLEKAPYVAAIIPESFLSSRYNKARLSDLISLPYADMFSDTDHPTCLALFRPRSAEVDSRIWSGEAELGTLQGLLAHKPRASGRVEMRFNDPKGEIGLYGVDSTSGPSIRFVPGEDIASVKIKHSSRSVTRISAGLDSISQRDAVLARANLALRVMRENTQDVGMTAFKGIRKDGRFRRRIDFSDARAILEGAILALQRAA